MTWRFAFPLFCTLTLGGAPLAAQETAECAVALSRQREVLDKLAEENARLTERVRLLEGSSITRQELLQRNAARLQGIARDVKGQRQAMADFEGYVKWMSGSLSSYSKYVEAGTAAASLAKFLPIPYAGQAGMFAKFVAHFALSLNATSNAIEKYLKTAQQFVARADGIDAAKPNGAGEIADLTRFADEQLLKDTSDAQAKLATTSDLSASALSFLEGMNQYVACTDEYWSKTKQFVTRKEADGKEKSYLSESIQGLKTQATSFNNRLRLFDDAAKRNAPLIKSLAAFDELVRAIDGKSASKTL